MRIGAEQLTEIFNKELSRYNPLKEAIEVYKDILIESYLEQTKDIQNSKKQISVQLKDLENRISHIRDLLATDKIDASEYHEIKNQYSTSIDQLNKKFQEVCGRIPDMDDLLKNDISKFLKLDTVLQQSSSEDFRGFLNLIFPEKLLFDGISFSKSKFSTAVKLCYSYH